MEEDTDRGSQGISFSHTFRLISVCQKPSRKGVLGQELTIVASEKLWVAWNMLGLEILSRHKPTSAVAYYVFYFIVIERVSPGRLH